MVGSDQVPSPDDYERAFGRGSCAIVHRSTNLQPWNESSTELRFASFLAPLCGVREAVKGRDERPKNGRP